MIADAMLAAVAVLGSGILLVAALVLVAESGLLVGVVLPGISVPVGLGVLAGNDLVPALVTGAAIVLAAVAGPSLGYWRARRNGQDHHLRIVRDRRVPGPARRVLTLAARRPVVAVAVGQWFAVARTLVPRLAGHTLRYPRFALVSVPVAAAWGLATFGLGMLLASGSAVAARAVAVQQHLGTVLLVVLAVVVGWTAIRLWRRRRGGRAEESTTTP